MPVFRNARVLLAGALLAVMLPACALANVWLHGKAIANLVATIPSSSTVTSAAALCSVRTNPPDTALIGISDPYHSDSAVRTLVKASGAKWARVEIRWADIETGPGTYDWSIPDAIMTDYAGAGVHVLGLINYLSATPTSTWGDIDTRFQSFMVALVNRYKSAVHYWEVFNEPNLVGYGWLAGGYDAGSFWPAYTLLLARASKIIHDNDASGYVVLGGMSSGGVDFTPIYPLGAAGCYDIFAYHPYGSEGQFAAVRTAINSLLTTAGDTQKPVWASEIGTTNDAGRVDYVNDVLVTERSAFDATFLFTMRDFPGGSYGLASADNTPKAAYATFQSIVGP